MVTPMLRTPLRILGGAGLLLVLVIGFFAMQINTMLQPVDPPAHGDEQVLLAIAPGTSSAGIASALEEAGLVRNGLVFRYFVRHRGVDQKLQAGNYLFRYGMSIDEIINELVAGNVYRPTFTVTIPEGLTLEQIAARLADAGAVDYAEFMALAENAVPTLGEILPGQRHAMEGFLYPDTYEFDKGAPAETIFRRLEARLLEVFNADLQARAEELGLTFHQVITLASLIEKEVHVPAERELVSAVIHNRMKRKMPLQIDATVIYALGGHKTVVLLKDLEVDSPYNTYRVPGLPPGPIAAPGKASILAILYPADVGYLYYRAKEDGTGGHYFAKTYSEHLANIRKARQNRGDR
jgi:UPF0755 protein